VTTDTLATAPAAPAAPDRGDRLILAAVLAAAVVGRLPSLGAWWTLDDWGLLARAAGTLPPEPGLPARWLGQHLWWSLTWPLFGLDAHVHAVLRILLHATSALLVVRLARHAGLPPAGRLLAGLVFAATPLAFTPLAWAAGVQDLLSTTCALGAVLCFAGPGRRRLAAAVVLALGSLTAKEVGLGLPVLMAGMLLFGDAEARRPGDRPLAWAAVLFLMLAAAGEAILVVRHFGSGDGAYATGDAITVLGNLGVFGFWMVSPGPVFASALTRPMAVGGGLLFVLWGAWAARGWRGGSRLPAAALAAALLALAPALPLAHHLKPYLAYGAAAAGALALGRLMPRNLALRPAVLAAAALLAAIGSFTGMRARMGARNEFGLPADPVVRATALSWQTTHMLQDLQFPGGDDALPHDVVLLQVPVEAEAVQRADELGEPFVGRSELHEALGGALGPNLVAGGRLRVTWANALVTAPAEALVLCEAGDGFRIWGTTPNALLYAAMSDVGLGHFPRARRHLVRAAALGGENITFLYDPGQMIVPVAMVLRQKEAFIDWTVRGLGDGLTAHEVGGLQDLYFNLLSRMTGQPVAALAAGSRPLGAGHHGPDTNDPKETP